MGLCYEFGKGVEEDEHKAVDWYTKAAEQGDPTGQYYLGLCYEYGTGVDKDLAKAFECYQRSADQDYPQAQGRVGLCYDFGTGVEQDYSKAVEWYLKSAQQEDEVAQCFLANCYLFAKGAKKNETDGMKWLQKSADQGHAPAQLQLSQFYRLAEFGLEENKEKAVKWCRLAAEQGDGDAINELGACYEFGFGVKKDVQKATEFYEESAQKGSSIGQYSYGECFEKGGEYCVSKDMDKALYWYEKSARNGQPEAMTKLGGFYHEGIHVHKNREKGIRYYIDAEKLGSEEAKTVLANLVEGYVVKSREGDLKSTHSLGVFYGKGISLTKNVEKAKEYLTTAANGGFAASQVALGHLIEKENPVEAVKWYKLAAEQRLKSAFLKLSRCYKYGIGVECDDYKAEKYKKESELREDVIRSNKVSIDNKLKEDIEECHQCILRKEDPIVYIQQVAKDRIADWLAAASQGVNEAEWLMGICYTHGYGVNKDQVRAFNNFKSAAEKGHLDARLRLGVCYYNGHGVSIDLPRAAKCFKLFAKKGDAFAQIYLGLCYGSDDAGVRQNYTKAIYWTRLAADQGDERAIENLKHFLEIETDQIETRVADAVDEELCLESVGSGSGLLDLTREPDDTSLGAELLDEVWEGEELDAMDFLDLTSDSQKNTKESDESSGGFFKEIGKAFMDGLLGKD